MLSTKFDSYWVKSSHKSGQYQFNNSSEFQYEIIEKKYHEAIEVEFETGASQIETRKKSSCHIQLNGTCLLTTTFQVFFLYFFIFQY